MSPGREKYDSVRVSLSERGLPPWESLSDEERENWERGALLPPVTATLVVRQSDDALKTR